MGAGNPFLPVRLALSVDLAQSGEVDALAAPFLQSILLDSQCQWKYLHRFAEHARMLGSAL